MSGIRNILAAVILVVIGLVLSPLIFDQVHDVRSDAKTETFTITTGTGQTTATVTLSEEHFHKDSVLHITVASNLSTDAPTAEAYNSATSQLTVSGLTAGSTRTLTVNYEIDALKNYPGAGAIAGLIPLLYVVGLLILAGGLLWRVFV